ncbi:MaoC family dehydratase [Tundrisphaera lichenicola]|uniref:MaoC family dehydratase n=1 Tax=Tundrisphaera lichenicola TaxID=2029860 RepID=UPI003EB699A8
MSKHSPQSLTFDDLEPGDEWESPSRTVTESDVVGFAGLSGDFNPIHVDHESARLGAFGRPVAHGLLGLSISSGLASHSPRVDTLAFLEIVEWKFLQPIGFGDTIRVVSRIESIQPKGRGRRAVVTWHRRLVNHQGVTVQEGRTRTLVRGRAGLGGDESSGG